VASGGFIHFSAFPPRSHGGTPITEEAVKEAILFNPNGRFIQLSRGRVFYELTNPAIEDVLERPFAPPVVLIHGVSDCRPRSAFGIS
jgi:hypothetical protein